jgi:putative acetyltransferase
MPGSVGTVVVVGGGSEAAVVVGAGPVVGEDEDVHAAVTNPTATTAAIHRIPGTIGDDTARGTRSLSPMLRRATPADHDTIVALWLESTIAGQAFLPAEFWRGDEPVVRDELLPQAETWVIEEGGELVAFASVLGNLLGGLFTHTQHQGRGHGRALVEHLETAFDPLFVEVYAANEAARRFYHRRGFVDYERRTDERTGLEMLTLKMGR